jgi:hypothetical protein
MPVTDRMLIGAIAANPASATGGEYRYCRTCDVLYFSSPSQPELAHEAHDTVLLPALNPDGHKRMERAFRAFLRRWPLQRQQELTAFAERKGWELAWELKYGGGALEEHESAEWQVVVNNELRRLTAKARAHMQAQPEAVPQ